MFYHILSLSLFFFLNVCVCVYIFRYGFRVKLDTINDLLKLLMVNPHNEIRLMNLQWALTECWRPNWWLTFDVSFGLDTLKMKPPHKTVGCTRSHTDDFLLVSSTFSFSRGHTYIRLCTEVSRLYKIPHSYSTCYTFSCLVYYFGQI